MSTRACAPTRARAGFTMTEIIAAMAILVVVMAIAIPNVISITRNWHQAHLDATAQQIYDTAQARLEELGASGNAQLLVEQVKASTASYAPGSSSTYKLLASATDGGSGIAESIKTHIQSTGIIENGGAYIIEFEPESLSVLQVFYWEGDENDLAGDFSGMASNKADRATHHYGAAPGDGTAAAGTGAAAVAKAYTPLPDVAVTPGFELVNGEDLYLKVTSATTDTLEADKMTVQVTVAQGSNTVTKDYSLSSTWENVSKTDDNKEVDIIFDSIYDDSYGGTASELSLQEVLGTQFKPGKDITVTAKIVYDGNEIAAMTAPLTANTAFAKFDGTTVEVNKVRHLRNLGPQTTMMVEDTFGTVDVTGDIDFNGSNWAEADVALVHRANADKNPLSTFVALEANSEFNKAGNTLKSTGGKSLKNFTIGPNGDNDGVGLFRILNVNVDNIKIENATVNGGSKNLVGTLAGKWNAASGTAEIKNCTVSDSKVTTSGNYIGGLLGSFESTGTMTNCWVESTTVGDSTASSRFVGGVMGVFALTEGEDESAVYISAGAIKGSGTKGGTVTGQSRVGGIVGMMIGATMADDGSTHCSSSANVIAGATAKESFAGGLIGQMGDTTATLASSLDGGRVTGSVTGTGQYVGGACGVAVHSTITGTEIGAAGSNVAISGGGLTGGLVGSLYDHSMIGDSSVSSKRCISYVTVTGADASYFGGLVGSMNRKSEIYHSESHGTVKVNITSVPTSSYRAFGGLCGNIAADSMAEPSIVKNCITDVDVELTGEPYSYDIGGFAGLISYSTVEDCDVQNNPTITTQGCLKYGSTDASKAAFVGGFTGFSRNATIKGCAAAAIIEAGADNAYKYRAIGGFIGQSTNGTSIENCTASGTISCYAPYVGCFVGWISTSDTTEANRVEFKGNTATAQLVTIAYGDTGENHQAGGYGRGLFVGGVLDARISMVSNTASGASCNNSSVNSFAGYAVRNVIDENRGNSPAYADRT